MEWTHTKCSREDCLENTECPGFPTMQDHIAMANAAFEAYAEPDGTSFLDFIQDVCLLAIHRGVEPDTVRTILLNARKEYHAETF